MTDAEKHCFTFCGDLCTCPAKAANDLLDFLAPALPVLETMCRKARLTGGADKAGEMIAAIALHRKAQS